MVQSTVNGPGFVLPQIHSPQSHMHDSIFLDDREEDIEPPFGDDEKEEFTM